MISVPHVRPANEKALGWWKSVSNGGLPCAVWVVWLRCQCGTVGRLAANRGLRDSHSIAADGTVSPSVVCPSACGFHEHVRLDGWLGGFA